MGVKINTYVGVMVIVGMRKVEVVKTVRRCEDQSCRHQGETITTDYCPHCGKPADVIETKSMEIDFGNDVGTLTDEALWVCSNLCGPDTYKQVALSNVKRKGKPERPELASGDAESIPLAIDAIAELNWFNDAFAKEIAILKGHYGEDSVRVIFGTVTYAT